MKKGIQKRTEGQGSTRYGIQMPMEPIGKSKAKNRSGEGKESKEKEDGSGG